MKKLLEYIPFHLLLCFITGILLQFYLAFGQFYIAVFAFIFCVLFTAFFVFKNRKSATVASWILFYLLGVAIVFFQNDKNNLRYYKKFDNKNSLAVFEVTKKLKTGMYHHKYIAEVLQVNKQKTVGKVLVYIQKDSLEELLEVGNRIFLKPKFRPVKPVLNPHQFNYKAYLEKQGVYEDVFIKKHEYKRLKNTAFSWQRMAFLIQKRIKESLRKYDFSENELAVMNALLLGQRQEVSKELIRDYSNAGVIHILAVSGLHIGIILFLLSACLQPLERFKKGKGIKTVLLVLFLWMFAFIAGLSASVVRAVMMFTAVVVGQSLQRKIAVEHSLIIAMFVSLLFNPMFLFDVGFQLSYVAVFGIVWLQPRFSNLWKPRFKITNYFWQLCTVSLAAQIAVLPISLFYFHQFPSLFLFSNLVIIPFLGAILMGGIIIAILAVFNILPQFLVDFYGTVISLMNRFVHLIAKQEQFLFQEISISFFIMLCLYLFSIVVFQFFVKPTAQKFIHILVVVLLLQVVFLSEKYQRVHKEEWIVFHKNRQAILGHRIGDTLFVHSSLSPKKVFVDTAITSYKLTEGVVPIYKKVLPNVFQSSKAPILVIDSLGIYQIKNLKQPIVLLQYSPKINLNRLIQELQPLQVIADGSNYKSVINQWKTICFKNEIPFYFTGEKGAFIVKKQ